MVKFCYNLVENCTGKAISIKNYMPLCSITISDNETKEVSGCNLAIMRNNLPYFHCSGKIMPYVKYRATYSAGKISLHPTLVCESNDGLLDTVCFIGLPAQDCTDMNCFGKAFEFHNNKLINHTGEKLFFQKFWPWQSFTIGIDGTRTVSGEVLAIWVGILGVAVGHCEFEQDVTYEITLDWPYLIFTPVLGCEYNSKQYKTMRLVVEQDNEGTNTIRDERNNNNCYCNDYYDNDSRVKRQRNNYDYYDNDSRVKRQRNNNDYYDNDSRVKKQRNNRW